MTKMTYEAWYGTKEVWMTVDRYRADNSIALQLWCMDEEYGYEEPYGTLTVCLPNEYKTNENCVFLDTNNMRDAEEFIEKYGIGKATDMYGFSGFCMYPEYELDMERIAELTKGAEDEQK